MQVVFLMFTLPLSSPIRGSEDAYQSTEDYIQAPLPVVISATQLTQPLTEAPAAVTVLERDQIEAIGARNIPELLRRVAGVAVGYENITNPAVSYQGMNTGVSRRMQVLIDGRSVYNPFFGGMFWADIPLEVEDIERIEFVRGPTAAIHGANAFLATISITTRHSAVDRGTYAKGRIGNNGIRGVYLRHGGARGDLSYRLTGAYDQDYGLDTRDDELDARYLSGRLDWNLTPTKRITALAGVKDADLGQGFKPGWFSITQNPFEACFPPHTRHLTDAYGQFRYDDTPSADRQTTLQFYYERFTSLAKYHRTPPCPGQTKTDDYLTERYDMELRNIRPLGQAARMIWGMGGRIDRIDNEEKAENFQYANQAANYSVRLFDHVEWRLGSHWRVNTGAMLEHNSLTEETNLSPRLALNYLLNEQQAFRLSIARGIRTPSFVEETWFTPVYASRGGRKAERTLAFDMGYVGYFPRYAAAVDLRFFWNKLSGLISDNPTTPLIDYDNVGEARIRGFELQANWDFTRSTRFALAYAYTLIDSNAPFGIDYSRSQPRHIVDVSVIHNFNDRLQGFLSYNYASSMEWLTFGSKVPSTHFLDARLAWKFQLGGQPSQLAVKFENLIGDQTTYRDINEYGRRIFAEFDIHF